MKAFISKPVNWKFKLAEREITTLVIGWSTIIKIYNITWSSSICFSILIIFSKIQKIQSPGHYHRQDSTPRQNVALPTSTIDANNSLASPEPGNVELKRPTSRVQEKTFSWYIKTCIYNWKTLWSEHGTSVIKLLHKNYVDSAVKSGEEKLERKVLLVNAS